MRIKLNNNGKSIGTINANKNSIKNLPLKYKLIFGSLLLGSGIAISAINMHSNTKVEEKPQVTDESLIDTNEITNPDLYQINQGNTILFVDGEYIVKNGYVIKDDLQTRYEFIDESNRRLLENLDRYADKDLTDYKQLYTLYTMANEEYVDSNMKNSYYHEEYLYDLSQKLIDEIHRLGINYRIIEAVTPEEFVEAKPKPDESYVINNYYVEKDSTLSEIVNQTADDKEEYKDYFNYTVNENDLDNPDLIYAGSTMKIKVDKEDLSDMGYELWTTPRVEFDERIEFIRDSIKEIYTLSGDIESKQELDRLSNDTQIFASEAMKYIYSNDDQSISEDLLNKSRELCDRLSLFGYFFKPEAKMVGSR